MELQEKRLGLKQRWKSRTPRFWKKVQRFALISGAIAGAIISAPVALPAMIITGAGYVAVASGAIAGMSQFTKSDKKRK